MENNVMGGSGGGGGSVRKGGGDMWGGLKISKNKEKKGPVAAYHNKRGHISVLYANWKVFVLMDHFWNWAPLPA